MCGICFLANFGLDNRIPSFLETDSTLLMADFLSFEKNFPILNKEKHSLNNYRFALTNKNDQGDENGS